MQTASPHSWSCMDVYVFATPYRVGWDYYSKEKEHPLRSRRGRKKQKWNMYVSSEGWILFFFFQQKHVVISQRPWLSNLLHPGKSAWRCHLSHAIWNARNVAVLGRCHTSVLQHWLGSGCQLGISAEAYGNFISETNSALVGQYKKRRRAFWWLFGSFENSRTVGRISDTREMGDWCICWAYCSLLER